MTTTLSRDLFVFLEDIHNKHATSSLSVCFSVWRPNQLQLNLRDTPTGILLRSVTGDGILEACYTAAKIRLKLQFL